MRLVGFVSVLQRSATRCMLKGGSVQVSIVSVWLVIEKCREWGEPLHMQQPDIGDASGSVDYW